MTAARLYRRSSRLTAPAAAAAIGCRATASASSMVNCIGLPKAAIIETRAEHNTALELGAPVVRDAFLLAQPPFWHFAMKLFFAGAAFSARPRSFAQALGLYGGGDCSPHVPLSLSSLHR